MTDDITEQGRYLAPGTRVRYDGFMDGGPEYGIVVQCWLDPEIQMYDCYIAFLRDAHPQGAPQRKPYILRYASTSVTVLDGEAQVSHEV